MASRKPAIGAARTLSTETRGFRVWMAAIARASGVLAAAFGIEAAGAVLPAVAACEPGAFSAVPVCGPWAQAERLITPSRARKMGFMENPGMCDRHWNAG